MMADPELSEEHQPAMSQYRRSNGAYELEGKDHCVLRIPQAAEDEKLEVVTLPTSIKSRLFAKAAKASLPQASKAREVLRFLADIDPTLRTALGSKADALRDPPFRVCVSYPTSTTALATSSYIALSYCWKAGLESVGETMHPSLPLTLELGQALLDERLHLQEGVWIDQLCIPQDDPAEKAIAIGTMNITYKSARLVVIVIEDVVLEENEAKVLQDISHQYDTLGTEFWRQTESADIFIHQKRLNPLFISTLWKLYSARWFTRAWCGHEYRVSGNRILLLAVRWPDSNGVGVLRMSASFLVLLSHLEEDYSSRYDEVTYSPLKREHTNHRANFCKNLDPRGDTYSISTADSDTGRTASFMSAYLDVFRMDSLYVTDRLAIVLNVTNSGLYVMDRVERTKFECCRILSLIALACKDPTVLTSRGPYLLLDERDIHNIVSWLQHPLIDDINEDFEKKGFRCLDQVPVANTQEINMDLYFLGTNMDAHYPSDIYLRQAKELIEESIMRKDTIWLLEGDQHPESVEARKICSHFARVMTCVLECGKDWIVNTDIVFNLSERTTVLAQGLDTFFYKRNPSMGFGELMQSNSDEFDTLSCFWNELCGIWLVDDKPGYLPAWFNLSEAEEDKVLMMCPMEQQFLLVMPVLLQHDDHILFNRFYFLEGVADEEDCWVAFAKTIGFGRPSIADERCRQQARLCRGQRLRGQFETPPS